LKNNSDGLCEGKTQRLGHEHYRAPQPGGSGFSENHNTGAVTDAGTIDYQRCQLTLPQVAALLFLAMHATGLPTSRPSVVLAISSDRTLGSHGVLHQKVRASLSILRHRIDTTTPSSWVSKRRRASLRK
jgi:hypothetical protein